MRIVKSYRYNILMTISTLFSGSYLWIYNKFRAFFEVTADPYIMIFFYLAYPILWGICIGTSIEMHKRENTTQSMYNWILFGLNIGLIYMCWKKFYDFSSYNLILCGILLIEILSNLNKKCGKSKNRL